MDFKKMIIELLDKIDSLENDMPLYGCEIDEIPDGAKVIKDYDD